MHLDVGPLGEERRCGISLHDAHEYLLKGGLRLLEMPHRPPTHQLYEDPLRVGILVQPEFLQVAEVRDLRDSRQVVEVPRTLDANAQGVASVSVLDVLESSVEDLSTLVDHEDEVAHLFGDVHVVCRENYGRS